MAATQFSGSQRYKQLHGNKIYSFALILFESSVMKTGKFEDLTGPKKEASSKAR